MYAEMYIQIKTQAHFWSAFIYSNAHNVEHLTVL